jgi:SAM-dependent methyltransferase
VINKLHLGAGKEYRKGWINVEHPDSNLKADFYKDLNDGIWGLDEDAFDHIEMHHVLEHLDNPCNALENIWLCAKKGARVIISVPHWSNPMSWGDLTHKRVCSGYSMLYYEISYPEYYSQFAKFKVKSIKYTITRTNFKWLNSLSGFLNISRILTEYFFARFIPISQVIFELEAVK